MSVWPGGSRIAFRTYLETPGGAARTDLNPFDWLRGPCLLGGRRPIRRGGGGGRSRSSALVA